MNPRQSQNPATYLQIVPAVLRPQEVIKPATQRAREALHDQRETARRALLQQQRLFLAGQNLLNTLASNSEAHNCDVQVQIRKLEHEAGAQCSPRQREQSSRFSQETNQALVNLQEVLVTEVKSEMWRRDEQVYDLRTGPSLQALHSEDVVQQRSRGNALDDISNRNTAISRDV